MNGKKSVREGYINHGIELYYKTQDYNNPHARIIENHMTLVSDKLDMSNVLDLACGDGLVSTLCCVRLGRVTGCDPYLYQSYKEKTGNECYDYTFQDIANGSLSHERYSSIICSFAMHLCEKSVLPNLLYQLAVMSDTLVIVSPHKRPEVNQYWELSDELYMDKVRTRIFKSMLV